ncbi:hypothetical protein CDL15_Pgr014230 [Punica granatum]|uniref:Uncharacterized protein n=1 Tax=Punica granatum TaxID=22663 RepID=A0A218WCG7_PUNGR|nr:hypothetical protein CDL15_Pgr014230 [Punica granatum]
MPISLSSMSLESSSAAAIPPKASPCSHTPCPPPPPRLSITHRRTGGRSFSAALNNHSPLKAQSRKPLLRPLQLSSSLHDQAAGGQSDSESVAQQALLEYLHGELGLPEEEAANIVSGAPKYLGTLIDEVKELDELPELWGEFSYRRGQTVEQKTRGKTVMGRSNSKSGETAKLGFRRRCCRKPMR